jgi:predicted phosphodiesterase
MRRIRISDEEHELIREQRDKRLAEANSLGGKITSSKIANARNEFSESSLKKIKSVSEKIRSNMPPQDKEYKSKGGKAAAAQRKKILDEYDAAINKDADYGFVFGQEPQEMIEGDLREDVVCIINPGKVGIISDAHWPFHDLRKDSAGNFYGAYWTAINNLREWGVDTLVMNGDMMDVFHLSKHEKIEAKRDWGWELDVARSMLRHLREFFGPDVRIIYREGNHEERFAAYIARKAAELKGTIHLNEMLHLQELNIEWYKERAKMKAGNMYIDHGHEYFGSGGGINPARSYMLKAFDNLIVGHVHKTKNEVKRRPIDGSYIQVYTTGCLCDLNPHYASRPDWNHGYGELTVKDDGSFVFNNRYIMDGKAV